MSVAEGFVSRGRQRWRAGRRSAIAAAAALILAIGPCTSTYAQGAAGAAPKLGPSGLPLPRFVSLKAGRVNVRVGPGQDYRVSWVFTRSGLPVNTSR